jgi:UDP-N-acetylglucosamine--N-acetylmuramyl-(pentapeptide) pyrophosphoryl-undecaprenol N-acetylglucosamine transferase
VTGLPVREEFFHIAARESTKPFTILITGGSRGALTLNRAARDAWPGLRDWGDAIYVIHQTGAAHYEQFRMEFEVAGVNGEILPFITDMPAAFARADLVICRSGAGAVSELAAAGKPSVLIPYPYAADDHQRHNAEQFSNAGAAFLVNNAEWTGTKMLEIIRQLSCNPETLRSMGEAARSLAHDGAARRAADILEGVARESR